MHRLRWGLSQREFADLIGTHKDAISWFELEKRDPTAPLILASQLLFGESARALFPAYHRRIENELIEAILSLEGKLGARTDPKAEKQFQLLERVSELLYELDRRAGNV